MLPLIAKRINIKGNFRIFYRIGVATVTQKQRTKLELIRVEGICKMILSKIDGNVLRYKIEHITGSVIHDEKAALFRMPRYQLIKLIESTTLFSDEDINNAYELYRYGLKPGFTLFSISSKYQEISKTKIVQKIKEYLASVVYDEEESYKNLRYKTESEIDQNVIEYDFTYLSKYNYLSEQEEPKFIYELEECYVWISAESLFVAIKNAPTRITNIIKKMMADILHTKLNNIKINKKLVNEIFGEENIKKGTFVKANASVDEAEKITIADSKFAEKKSVRAGVSSYDMTSSYLSENIDENFNSTLGVNCNQGKIYLTRNVNATMFRTWSIKRIKDIIVFLNNKENTMDFEIFKAKNIMDNPIWAKSKLKNKIIEKIIYAVYVCVKNNLETYAIDEDILEIRRNLDEYLYDKLLMNCDRCEEISFPSCLCGSHKLTLTKNNEVLCCDCGKTINKLVCDEGHERSGFLVEEMLTLLPSAEFILKIVEVLNDTFNINFSGYFNITDGSISVFEKPKGELVNLKDIKELNEIASIEINETDYDDFLKDLKGLNEKCRSSYNKDCNRCHLSNKNCCIMKLFCTYPSYRPSPHNASEFGDVHFPITLNGKTVELVGVAKSAISKKETLTSSENAAREMLQQILTITHDKRVGAIAAICPMRFHDQLQQEIAYISKITGTPILIMDDMFMARQLSYFKKVFTIC